MHSDLAALRAPYHLGVKSTSSLVNHTVPSWHCQPLPSQVHLCSLPPGVEQQLSPLLQGSSPQEVESLTPPLGLCCPWPMELADGLQGPLSPPGNCCCLVSEDDRPCGAKSPTGSWHWLPGCAWAMSDKPTMAELPHDQRYMNYSRPDQQETHAAKCC